MAYRRLYLIKDARLYKGAKRTSSIRIKLRSPTGIGLVFSGGKDIFWIDEVNTDIGDAIINLKRKGVS